MAENPQSVTRPYDDVVVICRGTRQCVVKALTSAVGRVSAKILLTVRSADSWYASMASTILKTLKASTDPASIGLKLIGEGVFGGRLDDRAHVIAVYEKNNADVQAAFTQERLLTYNLGDGWEPLCRFLGEPVPDMPFPRSNPREQFDSMMSEANKTLHR